MWYNEGDEYFYDKNEWVRIRIEEEHWNDLSPIAPPERGAASNNEKKSPYSIVVSEDLHIAESRLQLWCSQINAGFHDAIRAWTGRVVVSTLFQNTKVGGDTTRRLLIPPSLSPTVGRYLGTTIPNRRSDESFGSLWNVSVEHCSNLYSKICTAYQVCRSCQAFIIR